MIKLARIAGDEFVNEPPGGLLEQYQVSLTAKGSDVRLLEMLLTVLAFGFFIAAMILMPKVTARGTDFWGIPNPQPTALEL